MFDITSHNNLPDNLRHAGHYPYLNNVLRPYWLHAIDVAHSLLETHGKANGNRTYYQDQFSADFISGLQNSWIPDFAGVAGCFELNNSLRGDEQKREPAWIEYRAAIEALKSSPRGMQILVHKVMPGYCAWEARIHAGGGYIPDLASKLAEALHTTVITVASDVPPDPEWSWADAYAQASVPVSAPTAVCPDTVEVAYWNSSRYQHPGEAIDDEPFDMAITDERMTKGQILVDVAQASGEIDDILALTVEVNRLPGSCTDVPCIQVHFDPDNLAASIFKQGNSFIIRPETDVTILPTVLPQGEAAWILK